MRTRSRRPTPPADANELLAALRAGRLLPPKQIRRLAIQWSESRPDEPDDPVRGTRFRARELADAGLLTAWQVERLLAGEGRRLRLGRYRLLDWLGAGGMGSVYKAEHRLMKRVVALKILDDLHQTDGPANSYPTAVLRCRREVEAAAQLSHPNIVAAYDAVRAGGLLFLVMEYVEGIDLARLVAEAGPLPARLACEAIRQAALALQCAHERGLVHCDAKPSNLLLAHPPRARWDRQTLMELADGRRPTLVKLLDWGLARRLGDPDGPADDLEGTPDYMAPERGGDEPIDGRSDLYSLGCAFYHLLTGQPPFPGDDCEGKLLRHRLDAPTPVRALRPDLPAGVAAVVERLMARDRNDRPARAVEAAADLEACLALPPKIMAEPLGRSSPLAEQATNPVRRRLRPALAWAAAPAGVLAVAAALWPQPLQVHPAPTLSFSSLPFIVEGRPGGFASLAEAVAAADDGAVITVHGAGPYPMPPLSVRLWALTLRAAPGERPCLQAAAPPADPWEALLTTDHDLMLDGLDLRSPGGPGDLTGRLICCERAALRLTDCRLSAPHGMGIVYRNGGELSLKGCRVETGGAAISVEVSQQKTCKVRIADTVLDVREPGGAATALWAPEVRQATAVDLELTGDTIRAARATAFTALAAGPHVVARGNNFIFRDCLLSCAGYAGRDAWKKGANWEGGDNRYQGPGEWLTIDGAAAGVRGLAGWRGLWGGGESGSREEVDVAGVVAEKPDK